MAGTLQGLLLLNLLFLLAGSGIVWGVAGWRSWGELVLLSGVAYVCGLSAVCMLGTLVLIFGAGMSTAVILLLVFGVTAAGAVAGWARHRPLPRFSRPRLMPDPRTLVALAVAAGVVVLLYEFYRVARLQPLTSWDAWSMWMTKAKAIYFFGGLDERIFRRAAWPSYPLLVPTLAAMNFRFMGSPDTTTLAVQWWLLCVGFVGAGAGLLRRIAPSPVAWLFMLLAISIPEFDRRLLERTGDWPLDIFFALAALALLGWILTGESWRLWTYGLLLAAVIATKREGTLLAVCLVVGGIVASGWRSRRTWAAIGGVAVLAYLPNILWRGWWTSRHLPSDTPPGGLLHATFANIGKVGPAFHLVVHLLFEYQMWLAAAPIALAAAALCLWLPDRRAVIFFLLTFGLAFVGWVWENWAFWPLVPITSSTAVNPTARTVGSLVFLSIVCAPVLIGRLLAQRTELAEPSTPGRARLHARALH